MTKHSPSDKLVLLVILFASSLTAQTVATSSSEKAVVKLQAQQPAFDPSSSLGSRVTMPPDSVMQQFHVGAALSPTLHVASESERAMVDKVFQQLPPFALKAFRKHVRTISFLDGIGGNGVTMLEPGSPEPIFNVVVRAGILQETISDFLTRKERTCYVGTGSEETVSVEAGSLPALLYVLLHESVHIADISNRHERDGPPALFAGPASSPLTHDVWVDSSTTVAAYRSPVLASSWFRTRKPVSIGNAQATYKMLAQTPFVSLYGSSNWYDDIAELVACYYLVQVLHQPYRIVLRNATETLYSLTPMDSALVRSRFRWIEPLFD